MADNYQDKELEKKILESPENTKKFVAKGFEVLDELGAFEMAGNENDKPLSEKDIQALTMLTSQLEQVTKSMDEMYGEANGKSMEACIDNADTIIPEPSNQDFCSVMPDDRFNKMIFDISKELTPDYRRKFNKLSREQKVNVIAASSENIAFFIDNKEYGRHQDNLIKIYGKLSKDFPQVINRSQDKEAQDLLAAVMLDGAREKLDKAWRGNNNEERLEAVKTTCQALFKKDERDYPFRMCSGGNGIAGAYDEQTDFGVVADSLLKFPDWSMAMFVMIHENQHRLQHLQVEKLKEGKITENTAEYFQAKIFKSNFEGGYLSPLGKQGSLLEKMVVTGEYVKQPVETNANEAGYNFSKYFSGAGVGSMKFADSLARVTSDVAKIFLKARKAIFANDGYRKYDAQDLFEAGLHSIINVKNNSR
ncbi:MAG: hypothetical protein AB7U85_03145 [Alphaproteobacteria bacterium]